MALPDFEAWAIFAKVAETGSFTGAARELGLSVPTVSKSLARLETKFGEKLIHRTSRRFSLTEAGRLLAMRAAQLLAEAEAVEAEAQAKSTTPRGRVRLAAPMNFGLQHVAPLMPELLAAYPDLSLDLRLDDRMVDLVAEGIDVALRIADLPDSSLVARRLCAVRRFVVGTPAYFAAHGTPNHPQDLLAHACLGYAYQVGGESWRFTHAAYGEEVIEITPRLRANNAEALVATLMAGLGIAVQPDFLCWQAIAEGRLIAVLTDWQPPPLTLNLVTPGGGPRPMRTRVVIDCLVRHFGSGAAPWTQVAAT